MRILSERITSLPPFFNLPELYTTQYMVGKEVRTSQILQIKEISLKLASMLVSAYNPAYVTLALRTCLFVASLQLPIKGMPWDHVSL